MTLRQLVRVNPRRCAGSPVPRAIARLVPRAFDPRFDRSQFLPILSDRLVRGSQQGFQLRLRHQVSLDLEEQSLKLDAMGSGHVGQSSIIAGCGAVQNCTP
jgi:hypothetical protein